MIRSTIALLVATIALSGCFTRIESGEIGLRVNASKQIEGTELLEGSWNQTIIGDVLEFPVRDIAAEVSDKKPLTKESVAMDDVDFYYTYSINPSSVSELWTKQPRSSHHYTKEGIYLMRLYMDQLVTAAIYKAIREYDALVTNDKREEIEQKVKSLVTAQLESVKLNGAIQIGQMQARAMRPPAAILESSSQVVKSQNDLKIKNNEVAIAEAEARRMKALSENSGSSIAYMDAQARLNISEGIKHGKVHTVVVPADFKGMVNVGK